MGTQCDPTLAAGIALAGISAAHLIDESMWDTPAEFHLPEGTTELVSLATMQGAST
jgi:hypothetical protein